MDVRGTVAADGSTAVFVITQTDTTVAYPPARVRLPGLHSGSSYRLRVLTPDGGDVGPGQSLLEWMRAEIVLSGEELATVGIRPPVQFPQRATVLGLTRVASSIWRPMSPATS